MSSLVDRSALLERFDQDLEFLGETVEILASDGPQLVEEIRAASTARDPAELATKAHALKGMVSHFCAASVTEQILDIELRAREGALEEIPRKLESFAASLESLCRETRAIASGEQP